jgi:hypothetical protein
MLLLTDSAAEIIDRLTVESEIPESAGLRIDSEADEAHGTAPHWTAFLTDRPGPGDDVLEVRHGRLYLAPDAADLLADKVLDAEAVEDGDVMFHLRHQHQHGAAAPR